MQPKVNLFGGEMENSEKEFINLFSYENQVEKSWSSCGYICTNLGIPIFGEVNEKAELKSLLKWDKFSLYVIVDSKIFTYLQNKK